MLVQSLIKTKNSPSKTSKGVIIRPVSHSDDITNNDSPALAAVEEAAPLEECALKMLESIPELDRRFLIQWAKVADLTGL